MAIPPDRNVGPILIWVTASLDIIAVLLTSLRMWIRSRARIIGWDDWTLVLALIIANTRMIFQILQSFHGNGRHEVYLTDEQYTLSVKWGWYAQLGLFGGNCFCKISICLLLLRIKDTIFLRRLLYSVIVGLVLVNGAFIIILLAECSPVNAYWRPEQGHCWTSQARIYTAYIAVGYGVVVDILLSLLPAHIVWKIQMPLKKKLLVSALMGLGIIATGFGIARAAALGIDTDDITWDYTIVAIWSNVELWLAIIAANLALARSMYFYIRDHSSLKRRPSRSATEPNDYYDMDFASNTSPSNRRGRSGRSGGRRSNYDSALDGTVDQYFSPSRPDNAVVWSECRRASSTRSATASEMPLDPQIQKKTEVHIRDDANSESSHTEHLEYEYRSRNG